ncbi:MAG: preprotein translocase subunit SecE [Deltaproteobacteria bacterium]|nr:preprotein translocase subunit SecE [Deltaproteobacteria bacterium]
MGRLLRKKTANTKKKEQAKKAIKQESVEKKKDKKPSFVAEKIAAGKNKLSQKEGKDTIFQKAIRFLTEAKVELKKVVWPSKKQTGGSTLVVVILVAIIGLFLGLTDSLLSFFVRIILR